MRCSKIPFLCVAAFMFCGFASAAESGGRFPARNDATFTAEDTDLPNPLVFVVYGDTGFSAAHEESGGAPQVRQTIVAKVADEHPAAVFLNGNVPGHGTKPDYQVYRDETAAWHAQHLRIYPALGDQELAECAEAQCLERWWTTFPELRGRRWYSVRLGTKVLAIVLDTDSSLLPGNAQRAWLERQIEAAATQVKYVLIVLHRPPVADIQTTRDVDHNPRPDEEALAAYLGKVAATSSAQFVVSAGGIHNYERFNDNGVVYLVSGGGGAPPDAIDRTEPDLFDQPDFPNYHYVRFTLLKKRLVGEMVRLKDSSVQAPAEWEVRDRFELTAAP